MKKLIIGLFLFIGLGISTTFALSPILSWDFESDACDSIENVCFNIVAGTPVISGGYYDFGDVLAISEADNLYLTGSEWSFDIGVNLQTGGNMHMPLSNINNSRLRFLMYNDGHIKGLIDGVNSDLQYGQAFTLNTDYRMTVTSSATDTKLYIDKTYIGTWANTYDLIGLLTLLNNGPWKAGFLNFYDVTLTQEQINNLPANDNGIIIESAITNEGTRDYLEDGFGLNDFEVNQTGSLDFIVYDVTSSGFIDIPETTFGTFLLDTPSDFVVNGYFTPLHEYDVYWEYTDFESTVYTGSTINFTLGNYFITENGTYSFNGAGFDVTGIEVTNTGTIDFEIKDQEGNSVWSGSSDIYANTVSDYSNILVDGTLDPNTTYDITWKYTYDGTTYNMGSGEITTLENLFYTLPGDVSCPDGLETIHQDLGVELGIITYCIQSNTEDLGIFYPLINTVTDTGEQTFSNTGSTLENLYGTGTITFGFTPGVIQINTGGSDETCNPMFDSEGNFNYVKGGTPSNFVHDLQTGQAFGLGERWEATLFGVNLIGWAYDFTSFLLEKLQSIIGNILDSVLGIFDEYFSALRVPARNQNYCFLGKNMYLPTNLTSYYSYSKGETVTYTDKNPIEFIVLMVLSIFILYYVNKII